MSLILTFIDHIPIEGGELGHLCQRFSSSIVGHVDAKVIRTGFFPNPGSQVHSASLELGMIVLMYFTADSCKQLTLVRSLALMLSLYMILLLGPK